MKRKVLFLSILAFIFLTFVPISSASNNTTIDPINETIDQGNLSDANSTKFDRWVADLRNNFEIEKIWTGMIGMIYYLSAKFSELMKIIAMQFGVSQGFATAISISTLVLFFLILAMAAGKSTASLIKSVSKYALLVIVVIVILSVFFGVAM